MARYVDSKTARTLYRSCGISVPKADNYREIMRILVEKIIPLWDHEYLIPIGMGLIPDALKCGTSDMLQAICEALAQEKLDDENEKRKYDLGRNLERNLINKIINVEKLAILLTADKLSPFFNHHTIPYRVGIALLKEAAKNPKLLYTIKQYAHGNRHELDDIPREALNLIFYLSNEINWQRELDSEVGTLFRNETDLSSLNIASLRAVLNSCMSPFIYNNDRRGLRRLLMDGKYKSLAIKQIINEELAHRPIDVTFVRPQLLAADTHFLMPPQVSANDRTGVPLFNFYDNDRDQKQTTMLLLSDGEPSVKPIAPAVYQLFHPRFALANLKDQHSRAVAFMRGIQATRNKLNEYLVSDLTTIVEEYASLHMPADVVRHFLDTDDEQLMLQERISTLPEQCQRRIAQLYVGSKIYATKLLGVAPANK